MTQSYTKSIPHLFSQVLLVAGVVVVDGLVDSLAWIPSLFHGFRDELEKIAKFHKNCCDFSTVFPI